MKTRAEAWALLNEYVKDVSLIRHVLANAQGRRLAVIGMAAAVLLPLIVPGINTGLLNSLTQVGTGGGVGRSVAPAA